MKSKDQTLLEEAYSKVYEDNSNAVNVSNPDAQANPNKEKHIKALAQVAQILKSNPPDAKWMQSLHGILAQMYREATGPLKQKAGELAQFVGRTIPSLQGPQGRAALMFANQKLINEIEQLRAMAAKG